MPFYLRFLPALVFVFLVLFLLLAIGGPKPRPASPMEGQPLPEFTLPSLTFLNTTISSTNALKGPYIINVFASWCAPCEAEHPLLKSLHETGIPILGINWKDKNDDANAWLTRLGNPYVLVGSDPDGAVAVSLGVSGVPETFVVDEHGVIIFHHAGPLDENWMNDHILPHFTQFLLNRRSQATPSLMPMMPPPVTEEAAPDARPAP